MCLREVKLSVAEGSGTRRKDHHVDCLIWEPYSEEFGWNTMEEAKYCMHLINAGAELARRVNCLLASAALCGLVSRSPLTAEIHLHQDLAHHSGSDPEKSGLALEAVSTIPWPHFHLRNMLLHCATWEQGSGDQV